VGTGVTVLSVCYDDVLRVAREAILKEAGYEVGSTAQLSQALEMLSAVRPSCVVLDHTVRKTVGVNRILEGEQQLKIDAARS